MNQGHSRFLKDTASISFDLQHREVVSNGIARLEDAMSKGLEQFIDLRNARKRAGMMKHFIIEHLEEHLKTFEQNFTNNGGKILWAETGHDACKSILALLQQLGIQSLVKSHALVLDEIGLVTCLEKSGITCHETGVAEAILKTADEKSSHHTAPVLHHSEKEIAAIFHEKHGLDERATPADITAFIKKNYRKRIFQSEAAITGADFLICDTGSIAISENEGNVMLAAALPKIHIVVAGIDSLLASVYDLELFWPLLSSYHSGQYVSTYNSLISGPKSRDERDGPQEMVVVLVDNGRTRLLKNIPQRRALSCINCGACLSVCPVFRTIGGHAYGTVYKGPIGAITTPFLTNKFEEYQHLSFASTLCGKCTEVCPVGINLHQLLISNRRQSIKKSYTTRAERWTMWAYKVTMKKRRRLDRFSPKRKNYLFRRFFAQGWGERRERPKIVKSFASRYK